ncbi:MAG TPA: biotin/lipoyl-containing protein [Fimbriimonadaceae bacterium]|nr:biotin/lipoyl-containing protein [Fimbriimonadaceae bacterium]
MAGFDLDLVRHALKVAQEHGFAEVELGNGEASFKARFEAGAKKTPKPEAPSGDLQTSTAIETEYKVIKSPLVGFYRLGPSPLTPGTTVKRGDVVAIVNALGIANEVESPVSGEVEEVYVEDGQGVEFGQVLAKVKG